MGGWLGGGACGCGGAGGVMVRLRPKRYLRDPESSYSLHDPVSQKIPQFLLSEMKTGNMDNECVSAMN